MNDLKRYASILSTDDFGKLCKCYFYYIEYQSLPEDIDDRSEQLFNIIKKETDRKIKDKERKRNKKKGEPFYE